MNIHLKGPFFLTQRLLPLIKDGGRILNVSTGLTRFSLPGKAAYATMKGAMEVLTKYQEEHPAGHFNPLCVHPAGLIAENSRNRIANIIRLAYTPQRGLCRNGLRNMLVVAHNPTAKIGGDSAWRNDIQIFGQHFHRPLLTAG